MNEITLTGNVARIGETRHTRSGDTIVTFDVAVDNGYYDRGKNRWISRTVFQPVVAFRELAEHAEATFTHDPSGKAGVGMAVTVTGKLVDDSYTRAGTEEVVRRTKLEALDVAVSLRFATAMVTRASRTQAEDGQESNPAVNEAVA